jgi:hypothetical protein
MEMESGLLVKAYSIVRICASLIYCVSFVHSVLHLFANLAFKPRRTRTTYGWLMLRRHQTLREKNIQGKVQRSRHLDGARRP